MAEAPSPIIQELIALDPGIGLDSPSSVIKAAFLNRILKNGYSAFRSMGWKSIPFDLPPTVTLLAETIDEASRIYLATFQLCLIYAHFVKPTTRTFIIAGPSHEMVDQVHNALKEHFPIVPIDEAQRVWMNFWYNTSDGARLVARKIAVPTWKEITHNYNESVAHAIAPLMTWTQPPGGGQLLLWHGPPGTGKTYTIRALAWEWRRWCRLEYITDPDQLFGGSADYLMRVSLQDDDEDGVQHLKEQWRLLLLEDTGEILSADAKRNTGQGLSRLLNVVDGLLGQGLRVLVLITTNEDIGKLHPAVIRPGRCLSRVKFPPLTMKEARAWLDQQGHAHVKLDHQSYTLADLYSLIAGQAEKKDEGSIGFHR